MNFVWENLVTAHCSSYYTALNGINQEGKLSVQVSAFIILDVSNVLIVLFTIGNIAIIMKYQTNQALFDIILPGHQLLRLSLKPIIRP